MTLQVAKLNWSIKLDPSGRMKIMALCRRHEILYTNCLIFNHQSLLLWAEILSIASQKLHFTHFTFYMEFPYTCLFAFLGAHRVFWFYEKCVCVCMHVCMHACLHIYFCLSIPTWANLLTLKSTQANTYIDRSINSRKVHDDFKANACITNGF